MKRMNKYESKLIVGNHKKMPTATQEKKKKKSYEARKRLRNDSFKKKKKGLCKNIVDPRCFGFLHSDTSLTYLNIHLNCYSLILDPYPFQSGQPVQLPVRSCVTIVFNNPEFLQVYFFQRVWMSTLPGDHSLLDVYK